MRGKLYSRGRSVAQGEGNTRGGVIVQLFFSDLILRNTRPSLSPFGRGAGRGEQLRYNDIPMLRNFLHCTHAPKILFARTLRREQTMGERILWRQIRAKRFHCLKFRRQVPIGPFIVDFLCVEKKLIIEVDGASHCGANARRKDQRREHFLRKQGFRILRFDDGSVIENGETVIKKIEEALGPNS